MAAETSPIVSHVTIGESISPDPVPPIAFVPNDANLFPKWPEQLDKDAWEEWQVQGLAADGGAAITVLLFRHRLNAPAGFRIGIVASWGQEDGEEEVSWHSYVTLPHSVITSDASGRCKGVWRDESEVSPPSVSFDIAGDLSQALFIFDLPGKVVGTITLTSAGYDGVPRTEGEGEFMPRFWWLRPIPMARASADLTFFPLEQAGSSNAHRFPKAMRLREESGAFGALERGWTTRPHRQIISHNWWIFAQAGPYVLHVIWVRGRPEEGSPLWGSGRLYRDGTLISAPQHATGISDPSNSSGDKETLTLEYVHDQSGGGIRGKYDLDHVGQRVVFRSSGQTWEFRARHARTWYNMPTSAPGPGATGFSGFVLSVTGGLVNSAESSEVFQGPGVVGGGTLA